MLLHIQVHFGGLIGIQLGQQAQVVKQLLLQGIERLAFVGRCGDFLTGRFLAGVIDGHPGIAQDGCFFHQVGTELVLMSHNPLQQVVEMNLHLVIRGD